MIAALALTSLASASSLRIAPRAVPCAIPADLEFQHSWAVQRRDFQAWFTVGGCLLPGEELSNVVIHWGDRTTSAGTVAYELPLPPGGDGYVTAIVAGDHAYAKATCAGATMHQCRFAYHPYVTATDAQTGQPAITGPHGSRVQLEVYVVAQVAGQLAR